MFVVLGCLETFLMAICQAKWDSFVDGLNAEVWVVKEGVSLDTR